jgi:hypothetical protein
LRWRRASRLRSSPRLPARSMQRRHESTSLLCQSLDEIRLMEPNRRKSLNLGWLMGLEPTTTGITIARIENLAIVESKPEQVYQ